MSRERQQVAKALLRFQSKLPKSPRAAKSWGVALFLLLSFAGCALIQRTGQSQPASYAGSIGKRAGVQVTQAELQDDILRFESQFSASLQGASQILETSSKPEIRYRAALNRLIYSSNSLGIALGPSPEVNLLDMVAFIELSANVFERYWMPKVFGKSGHALTQSFLESKKQIWAIAAKVMSPEQKNMLQQIIVAWRKGHSEEVSVETVRLSAFSSEAGAKAAGLDQNVGGLSESVQQQTQAVDSARLFAERALYYAERAPFLFRLQARLGMREITDDVISIFAHAQGPFGIEYPFRSLTNELQKALQAARSIFNEVDQLRNRVIRDLAQLGVGLIIVFWVMWILSKLLYQYLQMRMINPSRQEVALVKKGQVPSRSLLITDLNQHKKTEARFDLKHASGKTSKLRNS